MVCQVGLGPGCCMSPKCRWLLLWEVAMLSNGPLVLTRNIRWGWAGGLTRYLSQRLCPGVSHSDCFINFSNLSSSDLCAFLKGIARQHINADAKYSWKELSLMHQCPLEEGICQSITYFCSSLSARIYHASEAIYIWKTF